MCLVLMQIMSRGQGYHMSRDHAFVSRSLASLESDLVDVYANEGGVYVTWYSSLLTWSQKRHCFFSATARRIRIGERIRIFSHGSNSFENGSLARRLSSVVTALVACASFGSAVTTDDGRRASDPFTNELQSSCSRIPIKLFTPERQDRNVNDSNA